MNLRQVSVDPCLYISKKGTFIIRIHIDNCLATGTALQLADFKKQLRAHFPIKELGFPNSILGIQLTREDSNISLHQTAYLRRLTEDLRMEESNHVPTPIIIPQNHDSNSL